MYVVGTAVVLVVLGTTPLLTLLLVATRVVYLFLAIVNRVQTGSYHNESYSIRVMTKTKLFVCKIPELKLHKIYLNPWSLHHSLKLAPGFSSTLRDYPPLGIKRYVMTTALSFTADRTSREMGYTTRPFPEKRQ